MTFNIKNQRLRSTSIDLRKHLDNRLVPGLKNMPVPVLVTLKIRYTNRKAPAQRPFLLAGELASPAGRVLVVLVLVLACFFRPGTLLLLSGEILSEVVVSSI